MMRIRWMVGLLAVGLLAGVSAAAFAAGAEDAPRMTREELKGMLDSTDLVILDVRQGQDWDASGLKIKGAQRKDPAGFDAWKDQLPRDKTLVLYCA